MADAQPTFADLCGSLPATTQGHLFAKHVLPILDTLDLTPEVRQSLIDGIEKTKLRWANYPQPDFGQRKDEVAELLLRLTKNTKLRPANEGIMAQNEILVELMWAILKWTKELWIVGVEFGQEVDLVHEALTFLSCTMPQINNPNTCTCTCIIPSIKIHHTFERSDGEIIESFTGAADRVVLNAILCVWRDMLLANLVKPENKSDSCWFVSKRMPDMLRDVVDIRGFSIGTLFRMLDLEACDDGDSDGDEEDEDKEAEDEDEDEEDMPPLVDLDNQSSVGASSTTPVASQESAGDLKAQSSVGDSDEESEEPSELTLDLDEEEDARADATERLTKIINAFATNDFKHEPTAAAYKVLIGRTPSARKDLLEHIATMPHTPTTFKEAVHILIAEKATNHITRMVPMNLHLGSRASSAMQALAVYYVSRPSIRPQASQLIFKQVDAMLQDMVLEIEFAFNGLTGATKKAEIVAIAKMPTADRPPAIKRWVDEVLTRPPESLSEEAQAEVGAPNAGNPFGFLAALSMTFGLPGTEPGGGMSVPLYYDPIEALDPDPSDPEFVPIVAQFRPEFSVQYETWMSTIREAGRMDKACANLGPKLYQHLAQIAPYIANKAVVAEMKSRCNEERQEYVRIILTNLHSFAAMQIKNMVASKKSQKAKEKAPAVGSSSAQTNTAGLRDFVSASPIAHTASSPDASPPQPPPLTANGEGMPTPQEISSFFYSLMGMTIPETLLGNQNAPPPSDEPAWDDVD